MPSTKMGCPKAGGGLYGIVQIWDCPKAYMELAKRIYGTIQKGTWDYPKGGNKSGGKDI